MCARAGAAESAAVVVDGARASRFIFGAPTHSVLA